jgi:hypothetical protein
VKIKKLTRQMEKTIKEYLGIKLTRLGGNRNTEAHETSWKVLMRQTSNYLR